MRFHSLAACACAALLGACGALESLTNDAAALAGTATRSVRDTLTNAQARALFAALVDTLAVSLGHGLGSSVPAIRDSLLGTHTRELLVLLERELLNEAGRSAGALRDDLLGPRTMALLAALRDELLGDNTRRLAGDLRRDLLGPRTAALVAAMRDTLLGPKTARELGAIRSELLGDSTRLLLAGLVDAALGDSTQRAIDSVLGRSLRRVQGTVGATSEGLARNAESIIWTAGAVVAALLTAAGLAFRRNRAYRKMLGVLTYQIHSMSDGDAYAELTGRISDQSKRIGVEHDLRTVLQGQGLLGEEAFSKRMKRST